MSGWIEPPAITTTLGGNVSVIDPTKGVTSDFDGTGFLYDIDGSPTSGDISDIDFFNGATRIGSISGKTPGDLDLGDVWTAIELDDIGAIGGRGADVIVGGKGNDVLKGVMGADNFAFRANTCEGLDLIVDFLDGVDMIRANGAFNIGGISITQLGLDTFVEFAGGTFVQITELVATDLTAADFIFYDLP